jgi:hypothetical protein
MKLPRNPHSWVLITVIVFPLLSIALILGFVSLSGQFEIPDFVFIDYARSGPVQELAQVEEGNLVLKPSPEYAACLQDKEGSFRFDCESNFVSFFDSVLYLYSNGVLSETTLPEIQQRTLTQSSTHPTENTTFGSATCRSPEFYPLDGGSYTPDNCFLSIRKGSWQTKNVSVPRYPMITNENFRWSNPQNIFWVIN